MSERLTEQIADGKTDLSEHQRKVLQHLRANTFGQEKEEKVKKKRRGPKGPNPLSCKKSSKPRNIPVKTEAGGEAKKKRRKKKKPAMKLEAN